MYFQIFYHILSDYGRKNSKFYDGTQMEICYCTQTGIFRTENFAWSWVAEAGQKLRERKRIERNNFLLFQIIYDKMRTTESKNVPVCAWHRQQRKIPDRGNLRRKQF